MAYSKLSYDSQKDDEKEMRNQNDETTSIISISTKNVVKYDGIICIWDIRQPSYPMYQLICDDEVRKIIFLPNHDHIIIGGRENGCIAAWDLSESNKLHRKYIIAEKSVYLRYPTYMTDCQWDNNHLHPIIALEFMNEDEFCSVDTFGIIHGWNIIMVETPDHDHNARNFIDETDLNPLDLGCRDQETIKISHQFKFDIDSNTFLRCKYSNQYGDCISIHPTDETKILFAYQQSIYLLERIGSDVDILDEFTLKYDVAGICHTSNNVISVAVKCILLFIASNK